MNNAPARNVFQRRKLDTVVTSSRLFTTRTEPRQSIGGGTSGRRPMSSSARGPSPRSARSREGGTAAVGVSRPPVSPPRVSARRDPPAPAFPGRISQPSSLARPPPPPDGVDAPSARGSPPALCPGEGARRRWRTSSRRAMRSTDGWAATWRTPRTKTCVSSRSSPPPRSVSCARAVQAPARAGTAGRRAREPGRAPRGTISVALLAENGSDTDTADRPHRSIENGTRHR